MKQSKTFFVWLAVELLIMFKPEIIVLPIMIVAMCPWILGVLFGKN